MTPRVYRLLPDTEASCDQDVVLRLGLASMAADPTSTLTPAQRQWIIDLAGRTTRLTPGERAKLKTPLLAWMKDRMPRALAVMEKQFPEGRE